MTDSLQSKTVANIKQVAAKRKSVDIYLINGVKLSGIIENPDDDGLVLVKDSRRSIVFLHAIATIALV